MNPALPFVVLGIFITASLCFYIGGCAVHNSWWPMFTVFPAGVTILCGWMFKATSDSGSYESRVITSDGWFFGLIVGITSMIALPIVFFRISLLSGGALAMHLIGDACTAAGFIVFALIRRRQERQDGFF